MKIKKIDAEMAPILNIEALTRLCNDNMPKLVFGLVLLVYEREREREREIGRENVEALKQFFATSKHKSRLKLFSLNSVRKIISSFLSPFQSVK